MLYKYMRYLYIYCIETLSGAQRAFKQKDCSYQLNNLEDNSISYIFW
jgi:hypothetical protein